MLNFRVTCFLTGHGFFKGKLYELGLDDDLACRCGMVQTAEHLLLECPLTRETRDLCLNGEVPLDLSWFVEREDRFVMFAELAEDLFDLHKRDVI